MLGIVIANWNGQKIIGKCMESLLNQSYTDFKIYIIDNNSKDESKAIITNYHKKLDIKLVELDYNSGFAIANNIGIESAIKDGCTYILTLNNDIEVPENCIEKAINEIKKNEADIYQLFMVNYYDRQKCDAAGLLFDKSLIPIQIGYGSSVKEILEKNIENIEGVCAGAAIYSVKALEDVKLEGNQYFDSNFFAYYEDVDLSLRLKKKGYKFKLLKESIVYHMHSATGNRTNGLKEYYLIRNLLIYTKRNQDKKSLRKNNKYYYIRFIKTIIKNLNNFKVIVSAINGFKDGVVERKKIKYNM